MSSASPAPPRLFGRYPSPLAVAAPRDLPSGGRIFLPKPWSVAELAAKTREALERADAA